MDVSTSWTEAGKRENRAVLKARHPCPVVRPELLLQGGFALLASALYAWVARLVQHRSLSDDARAANTLFATWWGSFAIIYGLSGLYQIAAGFGYLDLALSIVFIDVALVLICVGLWGLLGYLVYLYTGSRRWFVPLGAAYALFGVALLYLIAWMDPIGYKEGGFTVQLEYARQISPSVGVALGLLLAGPIVIAAIAYGTLYFRVKSPEPRYRIAMVAGGFLLWFGWSIVSSLLGLARRYPDSVGLYVWGQTLAILAPLLVVMAFRPPKWIRQRLAERSAEA